MKSNILILGAGQLALLLVEASFNISTYINKIYIYTDKKTNCCNNINCEYMEVIIDNYENINKIADKCNIITYDYESYSIDIFNSNNKTKIFPSVTILEIIQDKYKQKMYMLDNNINTPKFTYVNSYNDMINFINIHNYPVFLKNRKGKTCQSSRAKNLANSSAGAQQETTWFPASQENSEPPKPGRKTRRVY